jgi:IS4 transposase
MAGALAGLPAGIRLSDRISLGVIARTFPIETVRRVLAETGKASERERDLPAHVMVYYAVALSLYMGSSTREVLRCLLEGRRWLWGPRRSGWQARAASRKRALAWAKRRCAASRRKWREGPAAPDQGGRVRAIEYRLEGIAEAEPLYRLGTRTLEPARAAAADLAALYHERWEIEGALAELQTPRRGARVVRRSKTPELVRQEFWGLLLVHFAVRGLMHEAARRADEDPDRLSFLQAVRVVRRKLPLFAALPSCGQARPA